MNQFQLEPRHFEILRAILKKYHLKVWVFGSRSKGQARPLSDIDLAVKDPISSRDLAQVRLDFEDSKLPMKVDLVVWSEIDPSFQKRIEPDLIEFN
jgi:predicted nucleotidyltransferase